MGARGPMGKSVADLKLHGTYKPSRHGHRAELPAPVGLPEKPKSFKGEKSVEWDRLMSGLKDSGIVGVTDTSLFIACCNLWAKYCALESMLDKMPANKEVAVRSRDYFHSWLAARTKLGLTPIDRTRVKSSGNREAELPGSGEADFARKRG